ncbi:MAG: 4Fe-4S binding protein [Planctomycetes bacterium]|nr:4Fe-4S binding protein [Planctomycetota bacterium]
MAKAIMIDIEKCLACKSCEIACAVAHSKSGILEECMTEQPKPQTRVTVEAAGEFGVPMQCRHCEDAPCITVCPTEAIHRHQPDGPVLIEQDKCIGCKFCLMVCPFGVINVSNDDKVMVKCDLCIERTEAGQEPACVEACPTKALKLVDEKDLATGKRRAAARELVLSIQKDNNRDAASAAPKENPKENPQ